jgi:hypothetical protein
MRGLDLAKREKQTSRERKKRYSSNQSRSGVATALIGFTSIFMSIFAMFAYAKTDNEAILFFAAFVLFVAFAVPPLIDFLKSAALKGINKEQTKSEDWKKSMDRIENL